MADTPKLVDIGQKDDMKAASEFARRNLPTMIENAVMIAKLRRSYYDAYLAEGFTEAQALELCKVLT